MQNVSSRAIPIVRINEDAHVCHTCGCNLKCMVIAHIFKVAANRRTQITPEQMESLIHERQIRGGYVGGIPAASTKYGSK